MGGVCTKCESKNTKRKREKELSKQIIEVQFQFNKRTIWTDWCNSSAVFSSIVKKFEENESVLSNCGFSFEYFSGENNDKKIIDQTKALSALCGVAGGNQAEKNFIVHIEPTGMSNLEENYVQFMTKAETFIKPIFCTPSFRLIIIKKKENEIIKKDLLETTITSHNLDKCTRESTFCNGINTIFIHTGFDKDEPVGLFWSVKLGKIESEPEVLEKECKIRQLHSMIFVPSRYVFVIGGRNEKNENLKSVEFYDTEKEIFYDYEDMPEFLLEPSLCLVNSKFLYVITNNKDKPGMSKFFMFVTNLEEPPKWETIEPQRSERLIFNYRYFSVIQIDDCLHFFGGETFSKEETQNSCVKYNIKKNLLEPTDETFEKFQFSSKVFIPLEENRYAIGEQSNKGNEKQIIFFFKQDKIIHKMDFQDPEIPVLQLVSQCNQRNERNQRMPIRVLKKLACDMPRKKKEVFVSQDRYYTNDDKVTSGGEQNNSLENIWNGEAIQNLSRQGSNGDQVLQIPCSTNAKNSGQMNDLKESCKVKVGGLVESIILNNASASASASAFQLLSELNKS